MATNPTANYKTDQYFATLSIQDGLGEALSQRIEEYYNTMRVSSLYNSWRRSYLQYYRNSFNGSIMGRSGDQGEYTDLSPNHFHNILQHILTMVSQSRPVLEPIASNTDAKSLEQAYLAKGLLDYYMTEKRVDGFIKDAAELALLYGEGYVSVEWNFSGGEIIDINQETGAVSNEGDLMFDKYDPMAIIRDPSKDSFESSEWVITRKFENRWNLIAKFPELEEEILAVPSKVDVLSSIGINTTIYTNCDDVPYYTFYHKKTEAVPQGRIVTFLSSDTILTESALPYRKIPVYRITYQETHGSPFGTTVAFDLLPIQEAIDGLYSTVITNQSSFGVQNIAIPRGSNINPINLAGGLNIIEYDAKLGKPEAMNLTNTPPEIFNFMNILQQDLETISGVNSVARGNPEASLKSGSALALVQSTAIQFSQGFQRSYINLIEEIGTGMINILRDFAASERIVTIIGKANQPYAKSFVGDDLDTINRVTINVGNPLSKTTAGKVQMAETLLQNQLISNAQEYLQVLNTGNLDPLYEGELQELFLIRSENETLRNGTPVNVIAVENHLKHIEEHKTVLNSPEIKNNPQVVQTVLDHIQAHIIALQTVDPVLLQVLGQQSLAPQPAPGGAPQGGAATLESGIPQGPGEVPVQPAQMPSMPEAPPGTDPASAAIIEQQALAAQTQMPPQG